MCPVYVRPFFYDKLNVRTLEVLTLKQTGKVQKDLPVVLVGKEFWKTVINWDALFKFGTISKKDVDDLFFTDSAEEAAAYIIERLSHKENIP